jgi:hypothetical protein
MYYSEESTLGKCSKTGVYVLVELAKRQKLCDYENDKKGN